MTSTEDVPLDPEQKLAGMDRIKTICVLPAADPKQHHRNIQEELTAFNSFLENKTADYEKAVSDTSAVVFTANVLQNRVASWEFALQLTKLYEAFCVDRSDTFGHKLEELKASEETPEEIKVLIAKFSDLFETWDLFLKKVDGELEKAVGPQSLQEIAKQGDEFHTSSRSNSLQHSTLKTFIRDSAYDMTLISVVVSFNSTESAEHTVRMYEHLNEFQKYGCDVLMLTKENVGTGGGFLKIVGVPFRLLMGEQEALGRLLQYRQSAISLAGSRALHMFTEIICNNETLNMSDGPAAFPNSDCAQISSAGGTILVDKSGQVLYSYVGTDNSDWPDVAVLLENVRNHSKPQEKCSKKSCKTPDECAKKRDCENAGDLDVDASKKKCCIIL